ncbi:glutamate racemase [Shewanella denitrificans OS217]|uniref:Glutamate racemase n=1 Tax=Shewanella denitrificans (strain OS217 / ATCC BAA-1090 / DSM 15013) TaxID=318161 RepID=MURI_SHEDO|nr:glutamate racemase [Shewanella denitrificans]Q12SP7.1 RecName: Full=Glutamate racemase [Shewanella denitrificans OS217]ABE53529.1 glutamate racemase [Shewanella denitrificans OS217]
MSGPILVFDSGIGGLSVLAEIRKRLPAENYCYLFDNARLPYGDLSESELIRGCVELICQQVQQVEAKIVVVACNTASTLVLPVLRQRLTIPVVGVVPAIKPAALLSKRKHIGVLATPGTVSRDYTHGLISQFAEDCQVDLFGSSELVMLAEQKAAKLPVNNQQLAKILAPIKASKLDVLVLGCTHFPMIKEELSQYLGESVLLLDSGEAIANRVASLLEPAALSEALHSGTTLHGGANSGTKGIGVIHAAYTQAITAGLNITLQEYGISDSSLIVTK